MFFVWMKVCRLSGCHTTASTEYPGPRSPAWSQHGRCR
jgi:hypothetical protein